MIKFKQVQAIGLAKEYNKKNDAVMTMVRRFTALPFLKPQDVMVGFEFAVHCVDDVQNNPELEKQMFELSKYVYENWVSDTARFPVDLWTKFQVEGK